MERGDAMVRTSGSRSANAHKGVVGPRHSRHNSLVCNTITTPVR